jgi:acetyltransferase
MQNPIYNFFYPKSVCIVGASTKEKSIGYEIIKNIKSYGFKGNLYPINPKADTVLDYKCYHTIEEVSEKIDLAIIVVPKQFVESSIDSLMEKNVKSIILITAGFREIGEEGEKLEKKIIEKIKSANARLVGPNCMGVISSLNEVKFNATFVAEQPEVGSTGFLSQSGALGAAVLNSLRETDIKFAHFISVGNKADINENDIITFWENDNNIKTIALYLESFVNGSELLELLLNRKITKPVIVLKAGKTASGQKAASSHTGALSSSDKVVDAVLKQFGIIRVNDLNELFNTAKGFENFKIPKGVRTAVITNAGGPGILAVDAIEKEGLTLVQLSKETKSKLREVIHPEGSVENPVDLLPGATAEIYKKVNEIISDDENVDSIISIFVEPVMVKPFDVIEGINEIKSIKPIYQIAMPLPEFWGEYKEKSKRNLPIFKNPEDPAEVISNINFYIKKKKKLETNHTQYLQSLSQSDKKIINNEKGFLPQDVVNNLALNYNIPVVSNELLKRDEIYNYKGTLYPIVIKGISEQVVHKSELNAVKLNIKSKEELIKRAEEIINNFHNHNYQVDHFLIQPFIKMKHEILIGGYRDQSFGPMIMFGLGGKYVEVFEDTSIRSAYLCDEDIFEMIDETKIGKILKGVRGESAADINKIKDIIKSSALMLIENKNIEEFDLNPLIITDDNSIFAVDIRIKIN